MTAAGRNSAPAHKQDCMEQIDVRSTAETGAVPEFKSPTGLPVIPPAAVPYVALGLVALTAVTEEVANPAPWSLARALGLVVQLGGIVLGVASPGWRKR